MSEGSKKLLPDSPSVLVVIYEGEKTETQIFDNLKKHYPFDVDILIVNTAYCAEIYQLYREIHTEEFEDLFRLIKDKFRNSQKEIHRQFIEQLNDVKAFKVKGIYLFFDYDGHAQQHTDCDDEAIVKMLGYFSDEMDKGKLYISYPMVEALKHVRAEADFNVITVNAKNKIACDDSQMDYKQLVHENTDYRDFTRYDKDTWRQLKLHHIKVANSIVNGQPEKPAEYVHFQQLTQSVIFAKQLQHFIQPDGKVVVLSGFPFFIIDYFGEAVWREL